VVGQLVMDKRSAKEDDYKGEIGEKTRVSAKDTPELLRFVGTCDTEDNDHP